MINDSTDKTELTWRRSLAIDQTRLQRKLDDLLKLTGCWLLKAGHLRWIVRSARAVRDLVEYSDSLIQLSKSGSRTLLFTTLAHSNGIWRESGRRCGPALQWQGDSVQAPRWATRYAERCFGPGWLRGLGGMKEKGVETHRVGSYVGCIDTDRRELVPDFQSQIKTIRRWSQFSVSHVMLHLLHTSTQMVWNYFVNVGHVFVVFLFRRHVHKHYM